MKLRMPLVVLTTLGLTWLAPIGQAGVIRSAGGEVTKGSARVASVAANGVEAAAGGMAAAGKGTGNVIKTGAVDVGKGAKATPVVVGHASKAAAQKIWSKIW